MIKTWLSILLLCVFGHFTSGQTTDLEFYKDKYPDAEIACLKLQKKFNIEIKDEAPRVKYLSSEELIYLDKHLSGYNKKSVSSSKFLSLEQIKAEVKIPKGFDLKSRKIKDFTESGLSTDYIFYDDTKDINFDLGTLVPGAISKVDLEYNLSDLHILPVIYINPYINYEACEFELNYPKDVELNVQFLNIDSIDIEVNESLKSNVVKRTYTLKNLKARKSEFSSPNWRYFTPQMHVRIKSYKNKNNTVNVIRNLDDLYQWYYTFLDSCAENSNDIKLLSDSISKGYTNNYDKAKAIFKWVQKNIRYIAIEDGYMGLIPQKATTVNNNKYGDCKGMSNLLKELLQAQGLNAYHTWIGTRKLPYTYKEIASPAIDNHMITCLKINDETIFLDATDYYIPFGYPSSFIQGKQALVSINKSEYEVIEVPVVPAEKSKYVDNCSLYTKDNTLYGKCFATVTGYVYRDMASTVTIGDDDSAKDYVKKALSKGNNKFVLDSILSYSLDNDTGKVAYSFRIPDYVLSHENEQYINLNLHRDNLPPALDIERVNPIEFDFEVQEISHYTLVLDSAYKVEQLPENLGLTSEAIEVTCVYSKNSNSVVREGNFTLKTTLLNSKEVNSWNDTRTKVKKHFSNQVIIKTNEN